MTAIINSFLHKNIILWKGAGIFYLFKYQTFYLNLNKLCLFLPLSLYSEMVSKNFISSESVARL